MYKNTTQNLVVEIEDKEFLEYFYDAEVGLEISATISGESVRDWYGVEHMVHEFTTIENIEVDYPISINGVEYDEKELREKVGDEIQDKIEERLIEIAEKAANWEVEEPEPYDYDD